MSGARQSAGGFPRPPRQDNLDRAANLAFEALLGQSDEQMLWLGAEPADGAWRLPVLDEVFEVDLSERRVTISPGRPVGLPWSILALHYLAIGSRPEGRQPQTTFADLSTARSYAGVYQGRVIARLCATAGRDAEKLRAAAVALGGRGAAGGDEAFDFDVFPRVTLRLIWHAPDDEFPPSGTMLLPGNIESYFCAEDVIALSELLVSRLGGVPF